MSSAPKFIEGQVRALFDMLAPFGGIHLVFINPNGLAVSGKHFERDVDEALAAARQANEDGRGVYWTVNAVKRHCHKKPTKAEITHARFVHVDIDPPKTGGAFDKPAILAALAGLETPPSFVIDSGGGLNAYWRLDGPCENLASIEAINNQVRFYFDADACQNIDRVMRVPGTVNYPNAVKKARGRGPSQARWALEDEGTVYEPTDLAATFPAAPAPPPSADPVAVPANVDIVTPADLGLQPLDPIYLAIMEPPGRDRSGDGVAAARLMANAGHTDAQILGTLLNPANLVSAHYLDQRDPKRAAARTLQLVRSDGPASGEPLHPQQPAMSTEDFARFVANEKAKVRARMVPATLLVEESSEAPQPRIGVPAWQRDLGDGALAQFVAHTLASAPSPQPWPTLGAGLAMIGAAAGRRYAGPTGLRTNIYSIGIIDSGGGKDHPLRASVKLMIAAGLANHVGSSKIASGAGLITAITRNPSIYFPIDEIGFVLSSAADRHRAPRHLTEIVDNLTEFYSMAPHTYLGTAYANDKEKPREVIEQPNLCLFGVTTPAIFWGSLSSSNVKDGSLARMLIFASDNPYPNPQHEPASSEPPEMLVEAIKAIAQGADGHNPFPLGPLQIPKPYPVRYADERAAVRGREMREAQTDMLRQHQGTAVTGIIARLAENAAKLALVKAISDNPAAPAVSAADLDWGMMVSKSSVEALMGAVKKQVADTQYEADVKRLHAVIADAGSAGIDGKRLSRQTQFCDQRKRQAIIAHLDEAGMIRVVETPQPDGKPGRPRRVYYDTA